MNDSLDKLSCINPLILLHAALCVKCEGCEHTKKSDAHYSKTNNCMTLNKLLQRDDLSIRKKLLQTDDLTIRFNFFSHSLEKYIK